MMVVHRTAVPKNKKCEVNLTLFAAINHPSTGR
jgi:hypothetical protein